MLNASGKREKTAPDGAAEYYAACDGRCPVCDTALTVIAARCRRCDMREYQDSLQEAFDDDEPSDAGGL